MNKSVSNEELIKLKYSLELATSALSRVHTLLDYNNVFNGSEEDDIMGNICLDDLLRNEFWLHESKDGLLIPIGKKSDNEIFYLSLGSTPVNYSILVNGLPGFGKTTLLEAIIIAAAMYYSPENLKLMLIDGSRMNEFGIFDSLPHVTKTYCVKSDDDFLVAIQSITDEIARIEENYSWYSETHNLRCNSFERFCSISDQIIPRNLVVINDLDNCASDYRLNMLTSLIRRGRKLGFHFVVSSVSSDLDIKKIIPSSIVFCHNDAFNSIANTLNIGEAILLKNRFDSTGIRFKCAINSNLSLVETCSNAREK